MTAVLSILNALRKVPTVAWAIVLGVALTVGAWKAVAGYGQSRYEDGRRSVVEAAKVDGAAVGAVRAADSAAKARVDTVRVRVMQTRWRVDTLITGVPDSLRASPQIAALIAGARELTTQVDSLDRALDLSEAASTLRAEVDAATIVSLRIVNSEQARELKKRPTRGQALGCAALAFLAGVIAGVVR